MSTGQKPFVATLDIIESVIAKVTELGPQRRSALRKWIMEEYGVCKTTAIRYHRLAQERLLKLSGRTAEEHTAGFLAKLTEIIYSPDATNRERISALDKASLILGLYKGIHVQTPQHNNFERLTNQNAEMGLSADEHTNAPETGAAGKQEIPTRTAPIVTPTLHNEDSSDAGSS